MIGFNYSFNEPGTSASEFLRLSYLVLCGCKLRKLLRTLAKSYDVTFANLPC